MNSKVQYHVLHVPNIQTFQVMKNVWLYYTLANGKTCSTCALISLFKHNYFLISTMRMYSCMFFYCSYDE